jgi:plastocyanin
MEKEYIVTLHKDVDPIAFRQDMIADNMLPYVPTKAVTVANERPGSQRNTHYMLTDQEAVELENDQRVEAVELRPDLRDDVSIVRAATQVGDFNKSSLTSGASLNWGLRRMSALSNPYNSNGAVVGGYTHTLTGTGVDFVIQDSGIQADHPEFQDSFGNTRVQEIDWYQAQSVVSGTLPAGFYTDYDGHGTHVAGTAVGKTYGWAKNSKIYSIKVGGLQGSGDPNGGMPISDIFDVVKEWHKAKTPDVLTGQKRPTVINMSWGYFSRYLSVTGGSYRGSEWSGNTKVDGYGMTGSFDGTGHRHPARLASVDADVDELIDAGVTVVIAAGNNYHKIATSTDVDYNNYYTNAFGQTKYYHRGGSPFSTKALMVGAIDSALDADGNEQVAVFSEKGPGVDVYAPGVNIFSATSNTNSFNDGPYGSTSFRIANIGGTSMAAPQIAGLIATYGEIQPSSTPAQRKTWVTTNAKEQLDVNGNTGSDYTNYRSLMGGTNAYAFQPYNQASVMTIAGDETIVADAGAVEATYALTASASSVNEGQQFTVTLTTTGLVNGTIVPYTITGITSADIGSASLTGSFIIGTNQIITFTASEDNEFDNGNETFLMTLDDQAGKNVSVIIADTSKPDAAYALTSTRDSLGEGESVTITLTATNVLSGTTVPYTITGIDSADISGEPLTGNFVVGTDITRTYVIAADGSLEGSETLYFESASQTITVQINDTSNSPITYNLVASVGAVDEGESFYVDLNVDNGIPGVVLGYVVTGISATDLSTGSLSGTYTTGSVTRATFTVNADFTTEGSETFVIALTTIDNISTSVTINDTSTTLVAGDEVITTTGSGTFTVPTNVTSVSIMAVGAGGGTGTSSPLGAGQVTGGAGSGAVGIINNLAVTPGQVISYSVGAGGAGSNAGGNTTVTYGSVTYTAGGGQTSPAIALSSLEPKTFERKIGGAGGTTTGAWNIGKAGGAGGDSMRFNTGSAVVGGGGGGAGAGSTGGSGYPLNQILDPNVNGQTSPYNWTAPASTTVSAINLSYSSQIQFTFNVYAGSYGNEYAYILENRINQILATSGTWVNEDSQDYDAYYILVRNGSNAPLQVYKNLSKGFDTIRTSSFSGTNAQYNFANVSNGVSIETTTSYGGLTFARNTGYTGLGDATIIEFRGGVGTSATDLNTVQLAKINLSPEGNIAVIPQQTAGTGGGHGYVENWQSGTGITYGAIGGGATLTREVTSNRGGLATTTPPTLSISGAGVVKTGVAGQQGNNISAVTPAATSYEVGAGAGGVLVMGLATSGSTNRAETGQDGGIWIMYPGSRDKFEAPQYTLASNKTNANEGSTVTVSVNTNLSTTDPQIVIPYEITGVGTGDIDITGLTTAYGNIRGSLTQVANSKTFNITADNTFDGTETMNLKLIESLTATTQVDTNHYLPFMTDNAQDIDITINDTSDGTQISLPGGVTNSGAGGYTWTTGNDRNGTISGLNPAIVIDRGDTISWAVNASGHPFYIKEIQGSGANNQTNGVIGQGTQNSGISYTPTKGGRKYYQCSIHNDMNGEIYLADKHWVTTHFGFNTLRTANTTFQFVAHAGSNSSIVIEQIDSGSNKSCAMVKYTDRGSPIWRRSFSSNYIVTSAVSDNSENIYVGYSGSWNWETNTPSADYPSDAYITKLNASGTVQWQRNYSDGDGNGVAITAMAFASDGNIIAVGANYLQNLDSGLWVIKIDVSNGDTLTVKKANPTSKKGQAQDVAVDSTGNIYVYGTEIKSDDTETAVRLWKFNSSLTEQWAKSWYVDSDTGTGFNPAGICIDENDNPIIGLGHVDNPQVNYEQSHILKINPLTGIITTDWVLNDIDTQPIASDYRQSNPKLRDIDFDTRNNKIVCVGEQNKDDTNANKRGMVITFDDALGNVKFRNLHTSTSANLNVGLYKCSLDNTLNPNNRLWVSGYGVSSTQTGVGRVGGVIASVPINQADADSDLLTVEDWAYEVHGSISVDSNSPLLTHDLGMTIDDNTATAGGLVNGTTSTSVSAYVEYKMVLDISVQAEPVSSASTYALTSSASSINEGQSFTITLDTTNVTNGSNVPYTITGVTSADIGGVALTGTLTVQSNSAQLTYAVMSDAVTEGTEIFLMTLDGLGVTQSVTINDTSGTLAGQTAYTTPGTYSWVAPEGVTEVSVVMVGGGGGSSNGGVGMTGGDGGAGGTKSGGAGDQHFRGGSGGGGLQWITGAVTAGQSYTVVVGARGTNHGGDGGSSSFTPDSVATSGGGLGGAGGAGSGQGGGAGGAGGYSGNGGAGGNATSNSRGSDGAGGGGGGGGPGYQANPSHGGGVGILGQGASGAGGAPRESIYGYTYPGSPGSGGSGKQYGGGAGYSSAIGYAGDGAVRIIWGSGRAYPNTNTADV